MECNLELYQKLFGKEPTKNAASLWINERKKIGMFLSLLHSPTQSCLEMYFNDSLSHLAGFIDSLPNWTVAETLMMQQNLTKLAQFVVK
jgi:hypothetical protein